MNKFIYNILIFLAIPVCLIILPLDIFLRNQNSIYKEKYSGALKQKDSIQVLVLGNSHASCGVDPKAFDLVTYNMANLYQSLYFDKRIALSLLPHLMRAKYVLISVDYHSFYYSSQKGRDKWSYYGNGIKYKNSSYVLANISPTLFGYTPKVASILFINRIKNKFTYGNNIIDFDVEAGVNLNDSIVNGFISFGGNNKSLFSPKKYQEKAKTYNDQVSSSKEKEEILADLKGFIDTLSAYNITPILFTSPSYREYNQYLLKPILDDNRKIIDDIAKRYNLQYWDFMNSDMFEKGDFYNADHLNKAGAYKFGRMLNDSINKLEILLFNNKALKN